MDLSSVLLHSTKRLNGLTDEDARGGKGAKPKWNGCDGRSSNCLLQRQLPLGGDSSRWSHAAFCTQ